MLHGVASGSYEPISRVAGGRYELELELPASRLHFHLAAILIWYGEEFKIQDTCSSLNVLEIYFSNAKAGRGAGQTRRAGARAGEEPVAVAMCEAGAVTCARANCQTLRAFN